VYEKRISGHCCINGPQYVRTTTCECSIEDFEWYRTVLVKFCGSFSLAASFNAYTYGCMCTQHSLMVEAFQLVCKLLYNTVRQLYQVHVALGGMEQPLHHIKKTKCVTWSDKIGLILYVSPIYKY